MNNIINIIKYSPVRKLPTLKIKIPSGKRDKKNLTGLYISIGNTWDGQRFFVDFNDLGSLGIAGTLGSGKTTFLKSIIINLIHNNPPDELKFIIGSSTPNEFAFMNKSQYLRNPIIQNATELHSQLDVLAELMEARYKLLEKYNVNQVYWYNWNLKMHQFPKSSKPIDYIFFCIDSYDFLTKDVSKKERKQLDQKMVNILQLGRAAGVYLILSSSNWSNEVVGELTKVNFMNKVCFKTTSKKASEDVMWENGAQYLKDRGDAIISRNGDGGVMFRIQTPVITKSDEAIIVSK